MPQRIIGVIDESERGRRTLAEAVAMAAREPGNVLQLLVVIEVPAIFTERKGIDDGDYVAHARDDAGSLLEEALTLARRSGVEPETAMLEPPDEKTVEAIIAHAREWGADVIVHGEPPPRRGLTARFSHGGRGRELRERSGFEVVLVE